MTRLMASPRAARASERTYSSVNTRIAATVTIALTRNIAPFTPGTVMLQKRRNAPAPSIAAASCRSRPTFPSAAR